MKRYAVKLGEVHLVSEKPISPEEQRRALEQLQRTNRAELYSEDGLHTEFRAGG